jgi:allantoate deiminase
VRELLALLRDIAERRRIELETRIYQEVPATALDARITAAVREAIAACGMDVLELSSGAGHDAMMMAKLCPSGMIFLRCKDGISHNPAESITVEDADIGVRLLLETVRRLDKRLQGQN